MKLIHITAKRYPGSTADHHYVENIARAFYSHLRANFTFIVCNSEPATPAGLPVINLSIPSFLKRTVFFFFWIPFAYFRFFNNRLEENIFFSNDQNLLALLIFWKKLLGLRIVVTADWHMLTNTWKDKFVARYADYSTCTSMKLEQAVRRLAPQSNIHTIYGGVYTQAYKNNIDKMKLREELQLPKDKFLVSYVGLFMTMGMEKGIATMIETLSLLEKGVVMVFVGGKPKEIELYSEQAGLKGVMDRCIFLPIQPFDKVVKYEKVMDALVIPYPDKPHFRQFGFPMKIYEYMASGTPIIYTKLELLEEVVSDCAYGIAPDSAEDLAKAISTIQSNPQQARELAMKAQQKVEKYTWQERTRNILNLCRIILP